MGSINKHFTFFDIFFVILATLPLCVNKKQAHQLFERIFQLAVSIGACIFLLQISKIMYGMGYVVSLSI